MSTRFCTFDSQTNTCTKCKSLASHPGVKKNCQYTFLYPVGNWIAAALKLFGITEKTVSSVTGKPCGCKGRREKLNSLLGVKRVEDSNTNARREAERAENPPH